MSELLDQYAPDVERSLVIARECRSVLEPADVMQVTYLEAFLQITSFDPDRAEPFRAWLKHIAENNLRDAIRGLRRQKRPQPSRRVAVPAGADSSADFFEQLGITTTTPSRYATHEERMARLNEALEALPEDYGRAVQLYDLQALPIAEVARQLGRSTGAVHMLRARAHDRLRQILGPESAWFGSSA
jgi:RNA polymerase sigma-70 factor (ECF subfamily)